MSFGDYWSAMDRVYGAINESGLKKATTQMESIGLGPESIGTSTHPFQHQVQSFAAKIKSGAGRIELSFIGQGKGNAQQPNPESFGTKDRADLRALAEINKIKTSVHASIHQQSLAGFGQEGFSENARHAAVKEIERAIQFAAEATKGGAIVFHTHEWQRPLIDAGKNKDPLKPMFQMTTEERERAPKFIVDNRTGEMNAVRADQRVYEPKFFTAKEYEKELKKKYGDDYKLVGKKRTVEFKVDDEKKGYRYDKEEFIVEENDWVDIDGNPIKKEWILDQKRAIKLFDRVPVFDDRKTEFNVEVRNFSSFEDQARELRAKADQLKKSGIVGADTITAEELYFKTQLANQVLQARGSALFHGQTYEHHRRRRDQLEAREKKYEEIMNDKNLSYQDKVGQLYQAKLLDREDFQNGLNEEDISRNLQEKIFTIGHQLKDQIESETNSMRHIHESSAHADAQAKQALEKMNHVESVEKFGLKKTAQTIAEAAMLARDYTKKAGKQLDEKLYVAAENYRPEMYGSHPDEIRKIIEKSRDTFAEDLVKRRGMKKDEAVKEAKEYIKATIDSGHFNMWRQFFKAESKDGKEVSIDEKNKQFDKWMLKEMNKLAEEGLVGHVHLTDNFGYDDEHLSPGQGNTPIRDFVQTMKKNNVKDIIAEAGSFNGETVLHESWAHLGSPVYGAHGSTQFTQIRHQHFGYQNQPGYIVGAYSPSNEWKLWSEVDLH